MRILTFSTPQSPAEAARRLFASYPDHAETRRYDAGYSRNATTEQRVVSSAAT